MATKKNAVPTAVPGSVPSPTGTGAGSASNTTTVTTPVTVTPVTVTPVNTPVSTPVSTPVAAAPVVASKGLRRRLTEMLAGWQSVIPAGATVPDVPNTGPALTQAGVVAQLQTLVDNYTAVDAATLALQNARAPVKAAVDPAEALLAQLKLALVALLGPSSPQLAQFGLKPKAAAKPLPVEKKAAAAARRLATRAIRGTLTKAEKASLKSGPIAVTTAPAPVLSAPTSPTPTAGSK